MAVQRESNPPIAWGLTAFVLGIVGLMLFFLPILGAPISAIGALAGIAGCFRSRDNLRWAVAGVVVATLAFAIDMAIAYAPAGYLPSPGGPPNESVPDRPYVPPPSRWPG